MTPQEVTLKEHLDARFDASDAANAARFDAVEQSVRGVHHRLSDLEGRNSREHAEVKELLGGHGDAIAELQGERQRREGASAQRRAIGRAAWTFALGVATTLVGAVAAALATGLIGP